MSEKLTTYISCSNGATPPPIITTRDSGESEDDFLRRHFDAVRDALPTACT